MSSKKTKPVGMVWIRNVDISDCSVPGVGDIKKGEAIQVEDKIAASLCDGKRFERCNPPEAPQVVEHRPDSGEPKGESES